MFGFFFKRADRSTHVTTSAPAVFGAEIKSAPDQARQQALLQAEALNDEAAAVHFILQSTFADARLRAAQLVQTAGALEQVLQSIRNHDRRVAKLMQIRLDVLRRQQQVADQAVACITEAQRLLGEKHLLPNYVADLDRIWKTVDVPKALCQQFMQLRTTLGERLTAQTDLQRVVIDLLHQVRELRRQVDSECGAIDVAITQLDQLEARMVTCATHAEAISLPKQLVNDVEQEVQALRQRLPSLQQQQQIVIARRDLLAQWEAAVPASLTPEALQCSWTTLPVNLAAVDHDVLERRYQTLLQKVIADSKPSKRQPEPALGSVVQQLFSETLVALEQSLEDGMLQAAMDCDKALRAMDLNILQPTQVQINRLTKARNALGRLQDWARWGGNVSREELVKAAQELQAQTLSPLELAKKVSNLRARWKSLDSCAGSASKVLWESFNVACTTAYTPAAAYYQEQAEQRQANQLHAQALIEEVRQFASTKLSADMTPDWKAVAQFCSQKQQAWKQLGSINRSKKKSLDNAFAAALQDLIRPLTEQQQLEMSRREDLINQIGELSANQRDSVDRVRELQQRWQEQAKVLPLPHKQEQILWRRFRHACDAIFAQRKEAVSNADAERRDNLRLKEAQCALLEEALNRPESELEELLQQTQQNWLRIGQIPRAAEAKVEARYHAAIAALQTVLDQSRYHAVVMQNQALCEKLTLCQLVEARVGQVMNDSVSMQDWQARWQTLPKLFSPFEKGMALRFERALLADGAHAIILEQNRPILLQELLRLEILAGVDSPPALSRERLQLQVAVLQTSLKAKPLAADIEQQLLALCEMPALMDEATLQRLLRLVAAVKVGKSYVAR